MPGATLAPPAIPRRRSRTAVRAGRRSGRRRPRPGRHRPRLPPRLLLAGPERPRLTATGYDIAGLQAERDRLDATTQDLLTNIQRLGSGPAIRKQALDAGLTPLAEPIVVPAR